MWLLHKFLTSAALCLAVLPHEGEVKNAEEKKWKFQALKWNWRSLKKAVSISHMRSRPGVHGKV